MSVHAAAKRDILAGGYSAECAVDPNYARQLWSVIIEETCRIEEQL